MLTAKALQEAISTAAESGLPAIEGKAFQRTAAGWRARPGCLTAYYSSGERIVCGILLVLFWELYGSSNGVVVPENSKFENHPVDLVWPGGYFFLKALDNLTNEKTWSGIQKLLPGVNYSFSRVPGGSQARSEL